MTGEISLRGLVLPVGGIKDKVLAAHRAGIRAVILPERNRKDFEEIPRTAREALRFVWAPDVDRVLEEALGAPVEGQRSAGKAVLGRQRLSASADEGGQA